MFGSFIRNHQCQILVIYHLSGVPVSRPFVWGRGTCYPAELLSISTVFLLGSPWEHREGVGSSRFENSRSINVRRTQWYTMKRKNTKFDSTFEVWRFIFRPRFPCFPGLFPIGSATLKPPWWSWAAKVGLINQALFNLVKAGTARRDLILVRSCAWAETVWMMVNVSTVRKIIPK